MPAYAIFIRESTSDAAELEAYMPKAGASLAGHPLKVLAAYGTLDVLEGPPAEGIVVVEFPTREAALAWYESPTYQAAREYRFRGAKYRAFIVEGV